MTIIDQKNDISYPFLTIRQASELIGVAKSTIYRWQKTRKAEKYNHYLIVFNESEVTFTHLTYSHELVYN